MNRPSAVVLVLSLSFLPGCADSGTEPAPKATVDADDWIRPKGVTPIPAPADVAGPPADAVKTASGLAYKVLKPGTGTIKPRPEQTVVAHYTGWTTKGEMFDSSVARGEPLTYPLNQLIPGWIEGMQMMTTGEKRRLWVPGNLAYDGIPRRPHGTLVFDVELLAVR